RPYLSAGGYHSVFGAGPGTRAPGIPLLAAPPAPAAEPPNELVNEPTGEVCFLSGCTQSEPSIAVSGSKVVIGFNDSSGHFDGTNDISGYSYSVDGGMHWMDGGSLPLAGGGDSLSGDPALVFCNRSFYYASLYRTPGCSSGASVSETEPNDDFMHANQVSLGDDFVGNIESSSDVDAVRFFAPGGTLLEVTVLG